MKPFTILFLIALISCSDKAQNDSTVIALGSCSREYSEFQLWAEIMDANPDLLLLLGDNIYGDSDDMAVLREKYEKQKNHPDYVRLRSAMPVIGTWDDHDYGLNDGGSAYSMKKESKKEFLRFFEIDDKNAINFHEGVYNSYDFDGHRLKILMLDTRYFRDSLVEDTLTTARYLANETGDILGESQWIWLEDQLKSSKARLNIIGSSIQFISEEHDYEKWSNFPMARNRMIDLLSRYPDKQVLFLSGDRHISEFSKMEVSELGYPLLDFTCSGLTHSWTAAELEPNRHRIGTVIHEPNYGLITINWDTNTLSMEVFGRENQFLAVQTVTLLQ